MTSILSFNTGSFISMGTPAGSEKLFIEEKCKANIFFSNNKTVTDFSICYNNSKKLIEKLFKNSFLNLQIVGIQEFRFNNPNEAGLLKNLKLSFPGKKITNKIEKLTYNKNYYNNISSLIVDANSLTLFPYDLSNNFKAIVGGIELIEKEKKEAKFFEGITTIIDTNLTGKIISYSLFNLSKSLPKDQYDIRPALIVFTENFIIINIHAPWEKGLYDLSINKNEFSESDLHLKKAALNLKNIINKKIKEQTNISKKNIIFFGDFNDGYNKYPKFIKSINEKNLKWSKPIKTCCYSNYGLNAKTSLYKNYGDYIASSLEIIKTVIPYLDKKDENLNFSHKFDEKVKNSIPMSDHTPILVKINNNNNNNKKITKKTKNKKGITKKQKIKKELLKNKK